MNLSVPITPEIEARLRERAASAGKAPETYAAEVLARDLSRPSLDEVLEPVCREVEASNLSEDELSDLLERAKLEMRRSRPAHP